MSRRRWLLLLVLLVVVFIAGVWWLRGREESRQTAFVAEGSLDVTIQTTGVVYAAAPQVVRSTANGRIANVGVRVGDTISAGDIVVVLDAEPFERTLLDARRAQERAEFALQLAEARLAADTENIDVRLAAVSAAEDVERANRAVTDAESAVRDAVILSPIDGVVTNLPIRVGDPVGGQQEVATVVDPATLAMRASVDELDIPNVSIGAPVVFRPDAFPAITIDGIVTRLAPQGRLQNGATVFDVTVTFTTPDGVPLRPETNAEVTITTATRENALLIPERALRSVGERIFVDVVRDGEPQEQEISVGYRSGGQVEVVDGLSLGDEVVLR